MLPLAGVPSSKFFWLVACAACNAVSGGPDPGSGMPPASLGPLVVTSISPSLGSVAGGTRVTLAGSGLSSAAQVAIGGIACDDVAVTGSTELSCTTGSSGFREAAMDVEIALEAQRVVLPAAFTYQCLWTTTSGRQSCGAAPPGLIAPQPIAFWVTQFQDQHGFTVDTSACNLADTSDFTLGTQAAWFATDGAGTTAELVRDGMAPLDFRDQDLKIWLKLEGVAHLAMLDVFVGDSGFQNVFKFHLQSTQGQQWMTDGDWVSFTIPWAPSVYGAPNRAAITDVMIRAADDGTGERVRVHVNGLAAVPEPMTRYPQGVLSFTMDDDWATGVDPGARILEAHGFAGTSYVIIDTVGLADRATLADLEHLQDTGWDVAVHANTDLHHFARFTNLATNVVEDDVVDARAWLIGHGFAGYDHCAYPGGEFTGGSDVLGVVGRYFTSCRTIYNRQQETYPPSDGRKLRVFYVTNAVPLAAVEQAVAAAKQSREWLILVFHQLVTGTPQSTIEWRASDFAALADYVAASGIPVATVSHVLAP